MSARRCPRTAITMGSHVRSPQARGRPHFSDLGIAAASDPGAHHRTAIIRRNPFGEKRGHRIPVTSREILPVALG